MLRALIPDPSPRGRRESLASLRMPAVFFTHFDRKWQTILTRRQRAGGEFREGAGRTVGFVKVDHYSPRGVRRIDIQVTSRGIGFLAAGLISDDHEVPGLALFGDRVELILLSLNGEF